MYHGPGTWSIPDPMASLWLDSSKHHCSIATPDGEPLARGEIHPQVQAGKAPAMEQHNSEPGSQGLGWAAKQDGA